MNIAKSFRLATLLSLVMVSAAVAAPKIQSDYDKSANFATYKTFGFVSPPGTEVDGYPAEITQAIKAATQHEMESRGYKLAESKPDLLINFSALLAQKTGSDNLAKQDLGKYYRYRSGENVAVYKTWSTYAYDKGTKDYVEGTINVDIVDAAKSQLVWEGVAIGEVRNLNKDVADTTKAINRVIAKIFDKYEFRATP